MQILLSIVPDELNKNIMHAQQCNVHEDTGKDNADNNYIT